MKRALRVLLIVAIILVILFIAGLVLAGIFGRLLDVLYIALMLLALFSLLSTILLIYAILKLIQMVMLVRSEMRPLLNSMQETVGVAKETAVAVKETAQHAGKAAGTLVGATRITRDYAITPPVRAVALAMAGRQMVRVFLGRGHVRTKADERKRRQAEMLEAEMIERGE